MARFWNFIICFLVISTNISLGFLTSHSVFPKYFPTFQKPCIPSRFLNQGLPGSNLKVHLIRSIELVRDETDLGHERNRFSGPSKPYGSTVRNILINILRQEFWNSTNIHIPKSIHECLVVLYVRTCKKFETATVTFAVKDGGKYTIQEAEDWLVQNANLLQKLVAERGIIRAPLLRFRGVRAAVGHVMPKPTTKAAVKNRGSKAAEGIMSFLEQLGEDHLNRDAQILEEQNLQPENHPKEDIWDSNAESSAMATLRMVMEKRLSLSNS